MPRPSGHGRPGALALMGVAPGGPAYSRMTNSLVMNHSVPLYR